MNLYPILINVVLTCFNRKKKTVSCIKTLLAQRGSEKYKLKFFICDDGSTDGTSEAILELVSDAVIVRGNGNLFWAKGMSKALVEAKKMKCDFYLMVNDDVEFKSNMLDIMFGTYESAESSDIAVSGATQDPDTGEYSYGGEKIIRRGIKEQTESVIPVHDELQSCDRANWNCFLIKQEYFNKIGDIDDYYSHSYADYDYSNRILNNGGKIYISYQYIGFCKRNSYKNTWRDRDLKMIDRIKELHRPNGIPFKSAVHYWHKFDKKYWFFRVLRPYIAILKDAIFFVRK